jgi:hypothetical protein
MSQTPAPWLSPDQNPPYNATNFTKANPNMYNILQSYAHNAPQYPISSGSNSFQIDQNTQNLTYFSYMNQQTLNGTKPLPPFKTQAERLMYLQAQTLTAARNQFTGQNPSAPAGVPTIPDLTPIHLKVVNTTIVNPDGSYQMEVSFTQPTINRTLIGSYKFYVENTTLNTSAVSIITWDKIVDVSYPNVVFIYSNPILQPGNSFMFRVSAVSTNGIESTSTPFILTIVANS